MGRRKLTYISNNTEGVAANAEVTINHQSTAGVLPKSAGCVVQNGTYAQADLACLWGGRSLFPSKINKIYYLFEFLT
jgi:hypothetical protein